MRRFLDEAGLLPPRSGFLNLSGSAMLGTGFAEALTAHLRSLGFVALPAARDVRVALSAGRSVNGVLRGLAFHMGRFAVCVVVRAA
jgi:hypothetical protein